MENQNLNDEKHNYYLIYLVVFINQVPDFFPSYSTGYYAIPYFMRFTIDIVAFTVILSVPETLDPTYLLVTSVSNPISLTFEL